MLIEKETKALTDFQVATFFSTKVNIVSHWSKGRQSKTSPNNTKGVDAVQIPSSGAQAKLSLKYCWVKQPMQNHSEEYRKGTLFYP